MEISLQLMLVFTILFVNGIVYLLRRIKKDALCLKTLEADYLHSKRSVSAKMKFGSLRELEAYLFSTENSEYYHFSKLKKRTTISRQSLEIILSASGILLLLLFGGNVGNNQLHISSEFFLYIVIVEFLSVCYCIFWYEHYGKKIDQLFKKIKKELQTELL